MKLNYCAPINSLGYGVCGLNILLAARRKQWEIAYFPIGPIQGEGLSRDAITSIELAASRQASFDKSAPCIRLWHQFALGEMVGKGLHVGFPIFELDRFNERELHHLRSCDLVLVGSHWGAGVLRDNDIKNVAIAPFGVDRSIFNEMPPDWPVQPSNVSFGSHDGFIPSASTTTTFLNCGKWEYRKGHDFIVKAFNAAFTPQDDVRLIMNCVNPFLTPYKADEWKKLYLNSTLGKAGKITLINSRLHSQYNVASLMHKVDAGFFPARAEGFNLELLEMLSCGKHVIATDYSAHTEFLSEWNGHLIRCPETEVAHDGIWFHGQGNWAKLGQDQLDQAVKHMREIHRYKQAGSLTINHAGIETAKLFTWDKTVSSIGVALV